MPSFTHTRLHSNPLTESSDLKSSGSDWSEVIKEILKYSRIRPVCLSGTARVEVLDHLDALAVDARICSSPAQLLIAVGLQQDLKLRGYSIAEMLMRLRFTLRTDLITIKELIHVQWLNVLKQLNTRLVFTSADPLAFTEVHHVRVNHGRKYSLTAEAKEIFPHVDPRVLSYLKGQVTAKYLIDINSMLVGKEKLSKHARAILDTIPIASWISTGEVYKRSPLKQTQTYTLLQKLKQAHLVACISGKGNRGQTRLWRRIS